MSPRGTYRGWRVSVSSPGVSLRWHGVTRDRFAVAPTRDALRDLIRRFESPIVGENDRHLPPMQTSRKMTPGRAS